MIIDRPVYEPKPPVVSRSYWYYHDGRPQKEGLRIQSGDHYLFVAQSDIYQLADDLIEFLARQGDRKADGE